MKPHLETWSATDVSGGFVVAFDGETQTYMGVGGLSHEAALNRAKEKLPGRVRLATAAPEMVRALLDLSILAACPICNEDRGSCRPGCPFDAALTKAGFPDQESRDKAREEVGYTGRSSSGMSRVPSGDTD